MQPVENPMQPVEDYWKLCADPRTLHPAMSPEATLNTTSRAGFVRTSKLHAHSAQALTIVMQANNRRDPNSGGHLPCLHAYKYTATATATADG